MRWRYRDINAKFKRLCRDNNINLYHVESDKKARIVYKVLRTLKEKIWRVFTDWRQYIDHDIIDDIIHNYSYCYQVKFPNYDTIKSISEDIEKFCKEKNIPCSFSFLDIEQKIKIAVKSPLYIDYNEGLNEELGFKHTMFQLSPVGFAP